MKKIAFIVLASCLLTGCHIFNHKGEVKYSYEHPELYQVGDATLEQPVREINLTWLGGQVDIVYADIPDVRIHEEASYALDDTSRMRYYVDDEGCLNIQFCRSGKTYNPRNKESLEGIEKNLTIEVPRGTVLDEIDMDMVSTNVRIDSVASRELTVDGVFFDVFAQYPTLPEEISIEGVSGSLTMMAPVEAGMTIEMEGMKKYLNITSERPTRKESRKTILGDGRCKIDVDGVSLTLNINEL